MTRDEAAVSPSSLPEAVTLRRGRLEVDFRTVEELVRAIGRLACVLEGEGEEFACEYERVVSPMVHS